MDRIVWMICICVVANFILEFSGVWAQTKDSRSYGPPASPQYRASNNVNPDDVELVDPMQAEPTENNGRASRNKLFDNIFKVLIQNAYLCIDMTKPFGFVSSFSCRNVRKRKKVILVFV